MCSIVMAGFIAFSRLKKNQHFIAVSHTACRELFITDDTRHARERNKYVHKLPQNYIPGKENRFCPTKGISDQTPLVISQRIPGHVQTQWKKNFRHRWRCPQRSVSFPAIYMGGIEITQCVMLPPRTNHVYWRAATGYHNPFIFSLREVRVQLRSCKVQTINISNNFTFKVNFTRLALQAMGTTLWRLFLWPVCQLKINEL